MLLNEVEAEEVAGGGLRRMENDEGGNSSSSRRVELHLSDFGDIRGEVRDALVWGEGRRYCNQTTTQVASAMA